MIIGIGLTLRATLLGSAFSPTALFAASELGFWYDPSDLSTLFQDTAGTTPVTTPGQTVARVDDKSGNDANATQGTTLQRPTYLSDEDGKFIGNDFIDDNMTVTLPDLGTEATVAYVTRSEIRLLEDQTISGAYTLPQQELAGIVVLDRALTFTEKVNLIRYLASKVEGVNYGAEIDRLTLIALNAVDVFVYDTSKDSDGGAWRAGALAQASSWYNETLNTATRGARREFPAVAVIVAESNKVTIYDGDDPSLPMWMVFNGGDEGRFLPVTTYPVSSVFALNGSVSVGQSGTYGGYTNLRFLADGAVRYRALGSANGTQGTSLGPISQRNSVGYNDSQTQGALINEDVNDVAMTVLPDAPIDPATGLPVPTIAVATAGGVSVIKDDGTVVDSVRTVPYDGCAFGDDGLYYIAVAYNDMSFATYADILAGDGFGDIIGSPVAGAQEIDLVSFGAPILRVADNLFIGGTVQAGAAKNGVMSHALNYPDFTKGMSALTTSTYNTGWMNGDIKGAFLSDTDDTDLVATDTIDDRSVNGLTLTLGDICTVTDVATGAGLVGFTFASAETVTLGSDISSTGALIWWEKVSGDWQLNVNDLSGGTDYVNGSSGTVATGLTISGTTLTFSASKEMALARATATIPTAEQIAKIYNDEKVLFEPNAQATLYGASDAVTALAHDPDTGLLHVGTSAGRSVFQGLQRVGNTTTSVSKAISASGGLIVEK